MVSALKQHGVKTKKPDDPKQRDREMHMPHERDESDESEAGALPSERVDIKRAYEDLAEGQVNTDLRGVQGIDQVTNPPEGDTMTDKARRQTPRTR